MPPQEFNGSPTASNRQRAHNHIQPPHLQSQSLQHAAWTAQAPHSCATPHLPRPSEPCSCCTWLGAHTIQHHRHTTSEEHKSNCVSAFADARTHLREGSTPHLPSSTLKLHAKLHIVLLLLAHLPRSHTPGRVWPRPLPQRAVPWAAWVLRARCCLLGHTAQPP